MRTESRFLATDMSRGPLSELLSALNHRLKYRVTNFYLDDAHGQYSQVESYPPRLRVRIYSVEPWYFGNIELKFHRDEYTTDKRVWDLSRHWKEVTSLIPALGQRSLRPPPADSIFRRLVPDFDEGREIIDFEQTRYIGSLEYTRESWGGQNLRLSIDSNFIPAVLPAGAVVIEIKGDETGELEKRVAGCCSLRLLKGSKFALLKTYHESKL